MRRSFYDLVAAHCEYVATLKQSLENNDHIAYIRVQELHHNDVLDRTDAKLMEMGMLADLGETPEA